jgi:aerobic C4-dicarboxylate transport protein
MTASTIAAPGRPGLRRAWWKELWVQVMIAMAAGIALGALRPNLGAQMQPLGDAFIKAIRTLIAPIIFCTVSTVSRIWPTWPKSDGSRSRR